MQHGHIVLAHHGLMRPAIAAIEQRSRCSNAMLGIAEAFHQRCNGLRRVFARERAYVADWPLGTSARVAGLAGFPRHLIDLLLKSAPNARPLGHTHLQALRILYLPLHGVWLISRYPSPSASSSAVWRTLRESVCGCSVNG